MLKTILFLFGSIFTFVAIIMCLIAFIIQRNSVKKRKIVRLKLVESS